MATATKGTKSIKGIERIVAPPPVHLVADGFRVHGFLPRGPLNAERMSPFFLLDYNSKHIFPPSTNLLGVGPHPHRGFETVTIAYHGKVAHHDSMGGGGVIGEGDVQWMTAGGGILHKEYHEEKFNHEGGLFQMVQLWVNLPAKYKMTDPRYQAITNAEMGRFELPEGGVIEVIAGDIDGIGGPASTFSPVHLYNVKPKKGEETTLRFPASYTTSILAIDGSSSINGLQLPADHLAVFEDDGEEIEIRADEDSVLLVMSGEPLNEPIAQYGPFLMNTNAEIAQAIDDYQQGKFGYLE